MPSAIASYLPQFLAEAAVFIERTKNSLSENSSKVIIEYYCFFIG